MDANLNLDIMKRFLLMGNYLMNAGPDNVNRALIRASDESMIYIKKRNIYLRKMEQLLKCIFYSPIIFSGLPPRLLIFPFCRLLRKRVVYIMHGYLRYENDINKSGLSEKILEQEQMILKYATKIVAVSSKYADWVKHELPEYAHKVTYVNNGLDISSQFLKHPLHKDNKRIIAVSGGNRPIKKNWNICKAVEKLNTKGWEISIYAFGRFRENGEPILNFPFVKKMGQMDKIEYYKQLNHVDLFCLNSEIEPFGLVVGDAINCGCSLLMSKNVGAASIFNSLKDEDIICDNHDIDEIVQKIEFLFNEGNAYRLFSSVDREKCSTKYAYLRLRKICIDE